MLGDDADLNGRLEAMRNSVVCGDEEFHNVTLAVKRIGQPSIKFSTRRVELHDQARRVELRPNKVVEARHAAVWKSIG